MNRTKEQLATLRSKHGDKVDQLGALQDERASLLTELATLDRSLSEYLSHVSGGPHHVSGLDIAIALCDSGACSLVAQEAWDAIKEVGAKTGTLIGKCISDVESSFHLSYAASSSAVHALTTGP